MIRFKILFCISLLFMFSCSSSRFAKNGVFVTDVDRYFNPKENINVWVYGNYYPHIDSQDGVRLDSWYAEDRAILEKVNLSGRGKKVLFTAVPSSGSRYHLLAIKHRRSKNDTLAYQKITLDSSYYYQKDFILNDLDIRHVLIPFHDKQALSLVYYIPTVKNLTRRFSFLDYLARINSKELQNKYQFSTFWKISNCLASKQVLTTIPMPKDLYKKHKQIFVKIYAKYEHAVGIQYFQLLNPKANLKSIAVKLCPNNYIIEFSDRKSNLIHRDLITVQ